MRRRSSRTGSAGSRWPLCHLGIHKLENGRHTQKESEQKIPLITITILRHQRLSRWGHPINIFYSPLSIHPAIRSHSEFSVQSRPQISSNHSTWQSKRPLKGNQTTHPFLWNIQSASSVVVVPTNFQPTHQHHPAHQPLMILLFLFTSRTRVYWTETTTVRQE